MCICRVVTCALKLCWRSRHRYRATASVAPVHTRRLPAFDELRLIEAKAKSAGSQKTVTPDDIGEELSARDRQLFYTLMLRRPISRIKTLPEDYRSVGGVLILKKTK